MISPLNAIGLKLGSLLAILTLMLGVGSAQAVPVSLELVIAIDVSGSVSASEFTLQRNGTATAIGNLSGFSPFAATLVYWSGNGQQQQALPWTLITDNTDALAFAAAMTGTSRPYSGGNTGIGQAINYSVPLFNNNGYEGNRRVIDISGDGEENVNTNAFLQAARNNAFANGITVNGVAIGGVSLGNFYTNNVITATIGDANGLPVFLANDFADFEAAIDRKIEIEVTGGEVPEPMTAGLCVLGLAALGFNATRRRRA